MASPSCSLVISNITADGLPRWQANNAYWGLSGTRYPDMIVDSNGNYQACVGVGTSGATPPAWSSTVGNDTPDGGVTWKCVEPIDGNFYNALAYPKAAVEY